jgi:hypothetical protein
LIRLPGDENRLGEVADAKAHPFAVRPLRSARGPLGGLAPRWLTRAPCDLPNTFGAHPVLLGDGPQRRSGAIARQHCFVALGRAHQQSLARLPAATTHHPDSPSRREVPLVSVGHASPPRMSDHFEDE